MAKQDVLDAINATIVPNGAKAISAQALNNVLTMMTENAGEGGGSGDGALRVMVPDILTGFHDLGEFSLTSWEEVKATIETNVPGLDWSEMDAAVSAMIAHNAEVVQQLIEKSKAGQGVSVILDQTLFLQALYNVKMQMEPDVDLIYEDSVVGSSQFANYSLEYVKFTPEGEAETGISESVLFVLSPVGALDGSRGSMYYPESVQFNLQPDGSIVFEVLEEEQPTSGSGVLTFYFDPTIGGLTEEQKAKNAKSYASFFDMGGECSVILKDFSLPETIVTSPCLTMGVAEDGLLLWALDTDATDPTGGFSKKTYLVSSDGSITIQQ